jgi:hypothetical protein
MRNLISIFMWFVVFTPRGFAQIKQEISGEFKKLVFDSNKKWTAARWYVVGEWIGPNRVRWLGGGQSLFKFPNVNCLDSKNPVANIERVETVDITQGKIPNEILTSNTYFAIEVPASQVSERFRVSPKAKNCEIEIELKYSWLQGPGDVRPLLFLSPQKNKYFGHEIHLEPPVEKPESAADISMDLLMGFSLTRFPNVDSDNAKQTLILAPVAKARGEWIPFSYLFGMNINLEQVMASWGGYKDPDTGIVEQQALYSDWSLGVFLEHYFPVFDALHIRGGLSYYEHLADDNIANPTFSNSIKGSKYLVANGMMNFYFGDYILLGGAVDYGIPSTLGGVGGGVKQSMLAFNARFGIRVTSFMFLLGEGGMRSYMATGVSPEVSYQGFIGIRLDL